MYKPDEKRVRDFWRSLQDCWLRLYGSPFPTAAAINGHSPAGGCLFAMSCEYRVMLPKYTIGLNETQLGIIAPTWFMATMRNTISPRTAEMALTLGKLFSTEEALKIGLIDEIAKDKVEAIQKCEAFIEKYKKIPSLARSITKQQLRKNELKELEDSRESDVELFVSVITNEKMQKTLGQYMAFMRWRKRLKPLLDVAKKIQGLFKPQKKK
jgi:3,2-trans-enoyl-CoA isomerase